MMGLVNLRELLRTICICFVWMLVVDAGEPGTPRMKTLKNVLSVDEKERKAMEVRF